MRKIKIVWICHFSNKDVRDRIPLSSNYLLNQFKRLFAIGNPTTYNDFASWISLLIKELENNNEVDLHIVAPHHGLKRFTAEFELNNIHYHFFRPGLFPFFENIIHKMFKRKRSYWFNRLMVKKLLKKI